MALSVETGETTIAGGSSSATVTLATPVTVGESAATVTCHGESSWAYRSHATATLQTVVDGEYTELLLERGSSEAGISLTARWSVISHPDWTVQTVTATIASLATDEAFAITAVTLAETFIVQGGQRGDNAALDYKDSFCRSMLTSTTAGEIRRNSGDTNTATAVLYVVSWPGATVERGTTTLTGGTHASRAVAITAIDQAQAIVNFSYYSALTDAGDRTWTRAAFTSNSEITFTRFESGTAGDDVNIAYEVISHADWTVQSDSSSAAAASADVSHALSPNVDLARSCVLGSPVQGNSYSTDSAGWSARVAQHVSSVSAATSTRHDTTGTVNAHVFVVEFAEVASGGSPLLQSNLLRSSLLHSRLVR